MTLLNAAVVNSKGATSDNEEIYIFNNEAMENPGIEEAASSLNLGAFRRGPNENEQSQLRDTITVECQKLNGRLFNGTVNFSEAKVVEDVDPCHPINLYL